VCPLKSTDYFTCAMAGMDYDFSKACISVEALLLALRTEPYRTSRNGTLAKIVAKAATTDPA